MFSSLILSFSLLFFRYATVVAVQLKTEQGILDGTISKSRDGHLFHSFYAIPFAKPPVGDLRFEPPKDPEPWEGVRDAKVPPPQCIQWDPFPLQRSSKISSGQEDCLYLNVFTPNLTASLPVMVNIHGGGFCSGSSSVLGAEYFMDHPVVAVTIQYRLAIFGFLSAADEKLPGNYGMKDQSAALKWVQKNIAVFGGDPKRVTVLGQSAGGASSNLHLHSPLSTGLFHRVISQSGSALDVWAVIDSEEAKLRAHAVGVVNGCPDLETSALVECLRKVPAGELALTHSKFFPYSNDIIPPVTFGPVVESAKVQNPFLVKHPWYQEPVNSVPLIIGSTKNDGDIFSSRILSSPLVLNDWSRHYDRVFPLALYYADAKNASSITAAIKHLYFGDNDISMETGKNLSAMLTDACFTVGPLEAARRHNNKVFYYVYDHRNSHSMNEVFGNITGLGGVCHGDELFSLFQFIYPFPAVTEGPDYAVSRRLVNYWVNFMEKGDPNGEEKIWQPFEAQKFTYLHITTTKDIMEEGLLRDKHTFWMDTLFSVRKRHR